MLSDAVDVHGPRQLLRVAIRPSCFSRHARAASDVLVEQPRIPAASAGSAVVAGAKTNARSFE